MPYAIGKKPNLQHRKPFLYTPVLQLYYFYKDCVPAVLSHGLAQSATILKRFCNSRARFHDLGRKQDLEISSSYILISCSQDGIARS